MIKVYHAVNPNFGIETPERPNPKWPEEYELVAEADTDNLDYAYRLTNTIDRRWWENRGVKSLVGPARSTSIGDVLVDDNNKAWLCDHVGWKEIKND